MLAKLNNQNFLSAFMALFLIVSGLVYGLDLGSGFQNFFYVTAALLPVFFGFLLLKKFGFRTKAGLPVLFLWLGFTMFAIGEFLWVWYEAVLEIDAFPSLADVFYLAAYPAFLIGLWELAKHEFKDKKALPLPVTILGVVGSLVVVGVLSYLGIYKALTSDAAMIEVMMNITYNLGDLVLLIVSMLLLYVSVKMSGGLLQKVWALLAASFCVILMGDMLFLVFTDPYEEGIWIFRQMDLLWMSGYVLAALSFAQWNQIISAVTARVKAKLKVV